MNTRSTARYVLAATAALLLSTTSTLAGIVGGNVPEINTISLSDVANASIVGATGLTNVTIATGTINDNHDTGWRVTIVSGNAGILRRTSGTGANTASQVAYTNITFVKTGGTLGADLVDPDGQTKNIATGLNGGGVAGTTRFSTGGATLPVAATATTATVDYTYALRISAAVNTALLSGTYSDTITVTIAVDA